MEGSRKSSSKDKKLKASKCQSRMKDKDCPEYFSKDIPPKKTKTMSGAIIKSNLIKGSLAIPRHANGSSSSKIYSSANTISSASPNSTSKEMENASDDDFTSTPPKRFRSMTVVSSSYCKKLLIDSDDEDVRSDHQQRIKPMATVKSVLVKRGNENLGMGKDSSSVKVATAQLRKKNAIDDRDSNKDNVSPVSFSKKGAGGRMTSSPSSSKNILLDDREIDSVDDNIVNHPSKRPSFRTISDSFTVTSNLVIDSTSTRSGQKVKVSGPSLSLRKKPYLQLAVNDSDDDDNVMDSTDRKTSRLSKISDYFPTNLKIVQGSSSRRSETKAKVTDPHLSKKKPQMPSKENVSDDEDNVIRPSDRQSSSIPVRSTSNSSTSKVANGLKNSSTQNVRSRSSTIANGSNNSSSANDSSSTSSLANGSKNSSTQNGRTRSSTTSCGTSYSSSVNGNSLIQSNRFVCSFSLCNRSFIKKSQLELHKLRHSGPIDCQICGQKVTNAAELKTKHVCQGRESRLKDKKFRRKDVISSTSTRDTGIQSRIVKEFEDIIDITQMNGRDYGNFVSVMEPDCIIPRVVFEAGKPEDLLGNGPTYVQGGGKRDNVILIRNHFRVDRSIPKEQQSAHSDYHHGGYDQSHLAAAENFCKDRIGFGKTFVKTNCAPAMRKTNYIGLAQIERTYRNKVINHNGALNMTLPFLPVNKMDTKYMKDKVPIPTSFGNITIVTTTNGKEIEGRELVNGGDFVEMADPFKLAERAKLTLLVDKQCFVKVNGLECEFAA